ncbi:thaumatin-like protein 1b [Momordica charantia]|uniref:Thaumatin-like protein 1b n=1 Tax=Momordica charantia TaxID=3673 RepID=A0A6J1BSV8_MOMCH|nr:thaumatin-like protein 1b [Momordica charantia]
MAMAMASNSINLLFFSISLFFHFLSFTHSATITVQNNCNHTIWPGILSGAGTAPLSTTGFALPSAASTVVDVPAAWSGRIWARTYCSTDAAGRFSCATADCGSGAVECQGACAAPPATLAEFTLNGGGGFDFYDVSLVDGYNIAMGIVAQGGKSGNCTATGCIADLNGDCPAELRVMGAGDGGDGRNRSVACKSACVAFGKPEYCCSGAFANPNTCKASEYSKFFKKNCPRAYSYAFDDGTSTFTCVSANYLVSFCPSPAASLKTSSEPQPQAADISGCRRRSTPPSLGMFAAAWVAACSFRHLFLHCQSH